MIKLGLMAELSERSAKSQSESFLIVDDEYSHGLVSATDTSETGQRFARRMNSPVES